MGIALGGRDVRSKLVRQLQGKMERRIGVEIVDCTKPLSHCSDGFMGSCCAGGACIPVLERYHLLSRAWNLDGWIIRLCVYQEKDRERQFLTSTNEVLVFYI